MCLVLPAGKGAGLLAVAAAIYNISSTQQ